MRLTYHELHGIWFYRAHNFSKISTYKRLKRLPLDPRIARLLGYEVTGSDGAASVFSAGSVAGIKDLNTDIHDIQRTVWECLRDDDYSIERVDKLFAGISIEIGSITREKVYAYNRVF